MAQTVIEPTNIRCRAKQFVDWDSRLNESPTGVAVSGVPGEQ